MSPVAATCSHRDVVACLFALLVIAGVAHAEPHVVARRFAQQTASHAARVLFLDRCAGGCIVRGASTDDAAAQMSSLPNPGQFAVSEYAWGDARWSELVHCVREVYSPYDVTVTDVRPVHAAYNTVLVAGFPFELGFQSIAGIALIADDCSPYSNVMSFVFANAHAADDILRLCWAVAHESGHAFGLDHSYRFLDGSSACRDPMSYRTDCQGQRFFRDAVARCGEDYARPCACGDSQNAHAILLVALGPGTPITAPPVVTNIGASLGYRFVYFEASAQRGIATLELWLNGYHWDTIHPPFATSQLYQIPIPFDVPDGHIDIVVVAKDDLGASGTSPTLTITKGSPCASAETCATGQRCEAGYCRWDPPVGELGDACTYRQYCTSGLCVDSVCTQDCKLEDPDGCPSGFACRYTGPDGVCLPGERGSAGGCAATDAGGEGWLSCLVVLVLVGARSPERRGASAGCPAGSSAPHPCLRGRARGIVLGALAPHPVWPRAITWNTVSPRAVAACRVPEDRVAITASARPMVAMLPLSR